MTQKIAPWERYADGEWHTVRDVTEGEPREESLRQYESYYMSARHWAARNGFKPRINRINCGRTIRIKFLPIEGFVKKPSLSEAIELIRYALHLRQYGECAPGGTETWDQFDRDADRFMRRTMGAQL